MSTRVPDAAPGGEVLGLLKELLVSTHDLNHGLARAAGVGSTDFRALDILLQRGPLGPNELGRRLGLTSPAATALADRLERAGHVERTRDPEDRRRVALVPTAHARDEALRVLRAYLDDLAAVVAGMGPDEQRAVADFLRRTAEVNRRHTHEPG